MPVSREKLRKRRQLRVRNRLRKYSTGRLRLSVFKSSKNIYAQIIDDKQKNISENSKKKKDKSGKFDSPIVTEITKASTYYPAEDYHQDFFENIAELSALMTTCLLSRDMTSPSKPILRFTHIYTLHRVLNNLKDWC